MRALPITITGSNLAGAQLSPKGTIGISLQNINVDENGRVITATVTVEDSVAPNTYGIVVTTPQGGHDEADLIVEAEQIGDVSIQYKKPKEGETNPVSMKIIGKFLHNAQITAPSELTVQEIKPSQDGTLVKANLIVNRVQGR